MWCLGNKNLYHAWTFHALLPSVPWWRCLRPECLKIQIFTSFFGAENYITNIHQVKHHKDRSHKNIRKIQYIHKHILKFEVWCFAMLFQMHLFRPETDCNQWDAVCRFTSLLLIATLDGRDWWDEVLQSTAASGSLIGGRWLYATYTLFREPGSSIDPTIKSSKLLASRQHVHLVVGSLCSEVPETCHWADTQILLSGRGPIVNSNTQTWWEILHSWHQDIPNFYPLWN